MYTGELNLEMKKQSLSLTWIKNRKHQLKQLIGSLEGMGKKEGEKETQSINNTQKNK